MKCACDQFFACSTWTGDQHIGIERCYAGDCITQVFRRHASADDLVGSLTPIARLVGHRNSSSTPVGNYDSCHRQQLATSCRRPIATMAHSPYQRILQVIGKQEFSLELHGLNQISCRPLYMRTSRSVTLLCQAASVERLRWINGRASCIPEVTRRRTSQR